jgi:hypothetical protein
MYKMSILIMLTIMLSASYALAGIIQPAGLSVDADNTALRAGGLGFAFGVNGALVNGGQFAVDASSGSAALQTRGVLIGQAAGAIGLGGISGAVQNVDVDGGQLQLVGYNLTATDTSPDTAQVQGLNVNAGQTALTIGGIGAAGGLQGALVGQKQVAVTPDGLSSQSEFVGIGQAAAVAAGPGSTAVSHQSVGVRTLQFQLND